MGIQTVRGLSLTVWMVVMALGVSACEPTCPSGTILVDKRCRNPAAPTAPGVSGNGAAPLAGAGNSAGSAPGVQQGAAGFGAVGPASAGQLGVSGLQGAGLAGNGAGAQPTAAGQSVPGQSVPGQSVPGQSVPGQSVPGAPTGCGVEICDNLDNDCDQKIDEEVTRPCGPTVLMGECKPGVEKCAAGAWSGACEGAVEPVAEICDVDGKDEDCDGPANEDCACTPGMMQMCGVMAGICVYGMQTCMEGGVWSTDCAGATMPTMEVCDGALDEDCDMQVDEMCECTNGAMMDCGMDVGECALGKQLCQDGKLGACQGGVEPTPEQCDERDNDCDGTTDEGVQNDCLGCRQLANPPGGVCSDGENSCRRPGLYICLGREDTTCTAIGATPRTETCDSTDEDCDGRTDEGLTNACNGPCRDMLPGRPGDDCAVDDGRGCSYAGIYTCRGSGLVCEGKCDYICVIGDAPSGTTVKDPCSFMADRPGVMVTCVPASVSCAGP
ncbi:MAG: MopE-related protein [Polyangiales bacterium]